jgi:hypothetical protein
MTTAAPYTAVGDKLKATPAVISLVGTTKLEPSIFARRAPEGIRQPATSGGLFNSYIVMKKTQGENIFQQLQRGDNFRVSPMGIYCFAATHTRACVLADAVIAALGVEVNQTGSQSWGAFTVDHCELLDRYDNSTDPSLGDEIDFYCEALEVKLFHSC